MEVSLSANPRALTLVSLASSSSHRFLRRQFLGSGHHLRPPGTAGLLFRRRKRRLNSSCSGAPSLSRSPRLVVRASSLGAVIVVAVVSVSAASFVFWNYYKSRKSAREVSGFALGGNAVNHRVIRSEMVEFVNENRESSHALLETEAPLQFRGAALMNEEAVVVTALESSSSTVLVSSGSDSTFMNGSSSSMLFAESTVLESLPPNFESFELEKLREEIESEYNNSTLQEESLVHLHEEINSGSGSHNVIKEHKINGVSVQESDMLVEVREKETEGRDINEEGESISYNFFLGEAERKDLHMFYDESKSDGNHTTKIKGNKSLLRSNLLKEADTSAQISRAKQENDEGKAPFAQPMGGPLRSRKDIKTGNKGSSNETNGILAHNKHINLPQLPRLNELDIVEDNHVTEKIDVYTRLLKSGRLSDAIDLLEDLERKGVLDMNKVYHGRFFKMCKTKKAVQEAFRFIKLIPNPKLSTYNMLMSVCASSQDSEGAFRVLQIVKEDGLEPDCKLYTTLISTCAKSGKVDRMFEVFHKMVNAGVEPNLHTYGALIDGCARAGQVAKAFGAYGIMSSKNVKPDRVVFNALITACGQSGAVDRAFDVLAEMGAELQPIEPDHVTIGALMRACANAGQVERAKDVYKMMDRYKIKGTPEVYTIAINLCSDKGDWEFICSVYEDMRRKDVIPDEMFLSALIDAAGHAGKLEAAFDIVKEARNRGIKVGTVSYSSLMGACSNANDWQKALKLYERLKAIKSKQTVSTVNALITSLCDGDQLPKAMEVFSEMKALGLSPNSITYSILLVASEKKNDLEAALMLFSQAKHDRVSPNLVMSRCVIGMCLRRYERACTVGEPILSFDSGRPQVVNKWTSSALMVYRDTVAAGVAPTIDILSQVLGCLSLPHDSSLKERLVENLGVSADTSKPSKLCSLIDGFGEYDPRAFSLLEEAASLGIISCVSLKKNPVVVDTKDLHIHAAQVYILTVLKGLKHRLAAGAKLPSIAILLHADKVKIKTSNGTKMVNVTGRVGQAVAALFRRLGLPYQGIESNGRIRINSLTMQRWLTPKLLPPFTGKPEELMMSQFRIGKGIANQQRDIRTGNLSLD